MKKERARIFVYIILVLAIISLVLSGYLLKDHYSNDSSICDYSETISCGVVNSSIYSEMFNVPIALLGIIWSIMLGIMAHRALKDSKYYLGLFGWSIFGLGSVVYLVWAEIQLGAICPFCTVVHVAVIISVVLSFLLHRSSSTKWDTLKPKVGSLALWTIGLVVVSFLFFNFSSGNDYDLDTFAQCVSDSGAKMYGSYKCGHCANQKAMFGDSFEFIGEVECHPDGENSQTDLCLEKGISGTPTWIIEIDGEELERHAGVMELEELAEFTGCTLE